MKQLLILLFFFPCFLFADVLFLQNKTLSEVLNAYEELSKKTIVRSSNLPQVTLDFDSHGEMSESDILRGLETLLAINGVSLVQITPRILKAVPNLEKEQSPEAKRELRVFLVSHGKAQEMVTLLNAALSKQGSASYTPSQTTFNQSGQPTQGQSSSPISGAGVNASVVADIRTNSIVVNAVPSEIASIASVIAQLDIVLEQVKIDVLIFEVVTNEDETSGISALGFTASEDGILSFQGKGVSTSNISGYDFSATLKPFSFSALLSLCERKSNVELLGNPSITTTHNRQAEFIVSEARPIITGVTSDGTNLNSRSSSITYKDIGIKLDVLPLIGNGKVQLAIKNTVERVTGLTTIDGTSQPIIGRRVTDSFITLNDGETLVLAGLTQKEIMESGGVLSFLRLRSKTKEVLSRELIIFIRPSILAPSQSIESDKLPLFSPDFEGYLDDFIGPRHPDAPKRETAPSGTHTGVGGSAGDGLQGEDSKTVASYIHAYACARVISSLVL